MPNLTHTRSRISSRSVEQQERDDSQQEEQEHHRSKRQRTQGETTDSPYSPIGTISPSPSNLDSHPPPLNRTPQPRGAGEAGAQGGGRISHACRPCNRSKVKCDGQHPCSRCFLTASTSSSSSSVAAEGKTGGQQMVTKERNRLMALELCVYQPSMRGRTKRQSRKNGSSVRDSTVTATATTRMTENDDASKPRDGSGGRDGFHASGSITSLPDPDDLLPRSRATRASPPRLTTATTDHERYPGVPTLQAAFYRSATLSQNSIMTAATRRNEELEDVQQQQKRRRQGRMASGEGQQVLPVAAREEVDDDGYPGTNTYRTTSDMRNDDDGRRLPVDRSTRSLYSTHTAARHTPLHRQSPAPSPYQYSTTNTAQPCTLPLPYRSMSTQTHHHNDHSHQQHTHGPHQLPLMADRAKLTPFPMPGDETNPLGVLAEASASLELERERELEKERETQMERRDEREGSDGVRRRAEPMVGKEQEGNVADNAGEGEVSRSKAGTDERIADSEGVGSGGVKSREDILPARPAVEVTAPREAVGGSGSPTSQPTQPTVPSSSSAAQASKTTATTITTPTDDIDGYYARPKQSTAGRRTLEDEAPHIMRLLTADDAHLLFDVYWQWFHPHLPVLDKERSEPVDVASRSNYLFNAICCCAARSFVPDLWTRLKAFAEMEMMRLPLGKTLDVVQAHLLYSEWNLIPAKRFEQDLTYLRAGLAIRTAIDINLHRVALFPDARTALPPWLLRSMIRTWLLTTVTDRTLSAQLGKPSSMPGESSVQRYLALLYGYIEESKRSGNHQAVLDDLAVALWAEWTQILNRALDAFRNRAMSDRPLLESNIDCYPDLIVIHEKQFQEWADRAENLISSVDAPSVKKEVRIGRIRLYHFYAELIIASFGLNQALERESKALPFAFVQFQMIAIRLIECFEHDLQSKGLIKGCPDFVFTALTYAVVSLLKSTQARYSHLDGSPTDQILSLCRRAADMLAKGAGASEHLPSIQATFLHRLLDIRTSSGRTTKAVAPPRSVNLQTFAQSFEHRNHETNWPPTVPPSGLVDAPSENTVVVPSGFAPHGHIGNDHISTTIASQTDDQRTDALTFGADMPFDLNSYLEFPNTTYNVPPSSALNTGLPAYGSAIDVQNGALDGFLPTTEHLPEIPVASLGLTMGNFMNDQGVMDSCLRIKAYGNRSSSPIPEQTVEQGVHVRLDKLIQGPKVGVTPSSR